MPIADNGALGLPALLRRYRRVVGVKPSLMITRSRRAAATFAELHRGAFGPLTGGIR
jgi:hypothetical protein